MNFFLPTSQNYMKTTIVNTYLGSTYISLKSGLSLVTNMSLSISSSLIVGGGRAMARQTMPSRGGGCFRVREKEN